METKPVESERGLEHDINVSADAIPMPLPPIAAPIIDLGVPVCAMPVPVPKPTPFLQQLYWTLYKNALLLYRRPITVFCMMFSSIFAVLLAWPAGRDSEYPLSDLDSCGSITYQVQASVSWYERDTLVYSLNDSWRSGLSVAILSLGPFVQGVCAFLVVHAEIEKKLLGVLRTLGVRESIFWLSWYIPFALSSLVNSLFAAIVAQFIPVHVFQHVYFGGIFASFFFLQLALVSSSLFLASLCGSLKRLIILILTVMVVAVFIPCIIISSEYYLYGEGQPGLFWINSNTRTERTEWIWNANATSGYYRGEEVSYECDKPILNEEQGTFYKTMAEREEVTSNEFFLGCYEAAGFVSTSWNPSNGAGFGLAVLSTLPYFHFSTMYSNFLGFTGMPDRTFSAQHASMSPEELAIDTLLIPPNEDNSQGTSFLPQGSTLRTRNYYHNSEAENAFYEEHDEPGSTCPAEDFEGIKLCDSYCYTYVPNSEALTGSPSVYDMMGYLVSLSLIYLILAAYWIQVFPAGNGAGRRFYFFLDPGYWFPGRIEDTADDSFRVTIDKVSKSFGPVQAVKGVSLELRVGEVTALLGHNGAGKTQLVNILSCETVATSGEVSIFGNSVKCDPFAVRCMIGVCKQDDYLWPDLSAREHLDIFAGLRGVDRNVHDAMVQKWLESVDLAVVQHKFSAAFSGGMKRRLSVALSTIGDRPFLILDEPTTGMDPVNRRFVWRHLDEIKESRVVLITTHAMEEADLLADEVAILRKGELAALGSPLELKSEHGSAFQFSILVGKADIETTEGKIKEMFQDRSDFVSVISGDSGDITVKIDQIQNERSNHIDGVQVDSLSNFIAWLECDDSKVSEYGFSNSSLEEVFITITKDDIEPTNEESNNGRPPAKDGCCCFGSSRTYEAENSPSTNAIESGGNAEFDVNTHFTTFEPSLTMLNQTEALVRQVFIRKWMGKRSIAEYVFFGVLILGTFLLGTYMAVFGEVAILISAITVPTLALSLMLPSIVFPIYSDKSLGLFHLMRTQGLTGGSFIMGTAISAFTTQLVYGFILLTLFYASAVFRETKMCEDQDTDYYSIGYYSYDNWCRTQSFGESYRTYGQSVWNPFDTPAEPIGVTATGTPGGYGKILLIPFLFALSTPGSVFASSVIPGNYKFAMIIVVFFTLLASVAPLVYYIFSSVAYMDSRGARERCLSSLDPRGICDDVINGNWNATIAPEDYLNCIGFQTYGELVVPFLCTPAYTSLLPQFGAFRLLAMTIISDIKFTSDRPGFIDEGFLYCIGGKCKFPLVQSLYRQNLLFFFVGAVCLTVFGLALFRLTYFTPGSILRIKNSFSRCFMRAFGALFFCKKKTPAEKDGAVEEIILEEVINEANSVNEIVRPLLKSPDLDTVEEGDYPQVIDYNAKRACTDLPPVVMHKLRKVYPSSGRTPPKVALKSLDLHVPKGQVLGLLGKNGCGKSTCLNILSTNHESSGGLALVASYDVDCERLKVFEQLGNCAQFDVIWPSLTVKHHLEFFARLKGVPRKQLRDTAYSIAKAVGLGAPEVYNRHAGVLSGGMRRRLSIAISLVGAPSVLLLDEPTTGLDPSTRNQIWDLIGSFATEERAIIITTHMMIEADTLCNRIAIVSDGKLKVVATQQHLKDKFGSGYILQLNLVRSTQAHQDSAMAFAKKYLHKDAKLDIKQAKTLHVHLPRDINLDKVFRAMYSPERATEGCINQFLLQQSSLEDVFIAMG